jgi:predicted peptidase
MRAFYSILISAICFLACKQSVMRPAPKPGDSATKPVDTPTKPIDTTKKPVDSIETQPPVLLGITDSINSDIGGYYVGLPTHYKESGKKYPLLFFNCGAGVYGNGAADLPKMLKEALPLLLKEKIFPPDFVVNGQHFSFIVMAPQFKVYPDNPNIILDAINFAKATYPIDPSRVYLTGISNGSVANGYLASAYPSMIAAMVPVAGITPDSAGIQSMVSANLPVWAFHNNQDEKIATSNSIDFISIYNSYQPAIPARLTLFSPYGTLNHDAWTKAMNPSYKENGMNMYEWMLQYKR